MLVLRRKAGEAIVLNGVITIHVLAVEGERVKLGISAPPEVVIVRSELLEGQGMPPGTHPAVQPPVLREPAGPFREPEGEPGAGSRRAGASGATPMPPTARPASRRTTARPTERPCLSVRTPSATASSRR